MADERDPKVSQRYRELDDEAPPRKLDEAILVAARRAAEKQHAPLVPPAGRHRWYFALGAAAILVLAVAVTVQMERVQPDAETAAVPAAPAQEQATREEAARRVPDAQTERREAAPLEPERPQAAGVAEAKSPPERWLERIVQLRKEGRHEEADKQLAEFRRSYPEYKVPEAALR